MTANAGYHAYATGDVLTAAQVQYNLQNQTTMYFATSSARTTALSGVTVEGMVSYIPANGIEYYNGSAWVSISQAVTALTTKGDLLTYSTQDTRLPVGSDGQILVANSTQTTGLQWQAPSQPLQNPVLNSAFQVWQRGTSVAVAASTNAYTADRWGLLTGANEASTVSRQVTGDTTNLPNIQYCARVQRNSGQTGTTAIYFAQSFETINSIPFAGKTVTLSYYARAGANFSSSGNALAIQLYYGTGTDQNVLGTYTGATACVTSSATLTTTWQRFTATGTVSTNATEIAIDAFYTPTGTAGTNDYYEITGVQLEVGSVATPFHTFSTTLQGELAACQRYYWRTTATGSATNAYQFIGVATAATAISIPVTFPVEMRVAPSTVDYSNIGGYIYRSAASPTISAVTTQSPQQTKTAVLLLATTGLTINDAAIMNQTTTSSYVGLSAEL